MMAPHPDSSMKQPSPEEERPRSDQFDQKLAQLRDWRGDTLRRVRALIREVAPDVTEELKWMGTPVWSLGGILCTGETYKSKVKLTFAKGAMLPDPTGLFNSSLDGKVRRAIDIGEDEHINEEAFKALILEAVARNASAPQKRKKGQPQP